ncbi:hypothetical protein [Streptomyces odonnellii]|uniref:hypothetical protein n=1 Tax=Streptomyces odonnellii TaxID=1417980 RepID=UPI001E51E93C|nr:hypothetical protein [Streptomyces odonnellii]
MRIDRDPSPWQDLEEAHWLHRPPATSYAASRRTSVRLLDPTVLSRSLSRTKRIRAADWALRTSYNKQLRNHGADEGLAALTLRAHTHAGTVHGQDQQGRLTGMCGLPSQKLPHVLNLLTTAGFLATWRSDPGSTDLTWTLTRP